MTNEGEVGRQGARMKDEAACLSVRRSISMDSVLSTYTTKSTCSGQDVQSRIALNYFRRIPCRPADQDRSAYL